MNQRCGMIASRSFQARTLSPKCDPHGGSSRRGRLRTWTRPRRAPARSRVPANADKGSDGSSRATLCVSAWEDVASRFAAAVRFKKPK